MVPQELLEKLKSNLEETKELITEVKSKGLQNTQEALNWIDNLNKLSVEF